MLGCKIRKITINGSEKFFFPELILAFDVNIKPLVNNVCVRCYFSIVNQLIYYENAYMYMRRGTCHKNFQSFESSFGNIFFLQFLFIHYLLKEFLPSRFSETKTNNVSKFPISPRIPIVSRTTPEAQKSDSSRISLSDSSYS